MARKKAEKTLRCLWSKNWNLYVFKIDLWSLFVLFINRASILSPQSYVRIEIQKSNPSHLLTSIRASI